MRRASAFITCFGGGAPSPPAEIKSPTAQDASVVGSRDAERRRRMAAASNTVLTSYQGDLTKVNTQSKTLLGQ